MKFYLVCYKDGIFDEHQTHFIDECFANDFVNYLRNEKGFEGEIKFKTYEAQLEKEEVV